MLVFETRFSQTLEMRFLVRITTALCSTDDQHYDESRSRHLGAAVARKIAISVSVGSIRSDPADESILTFTLVLQFISQFDVFVALFGAQFRLKQSVAI